MKRWRARHWRKQIDGRNRFRACQLAGVEPLFEMYVGTDPLGFVVSENLHRRHLTETQRGMAAARLATLRAGRPWDKVNSPIGEVTELSRKDRAQAAKELSVGTSTVDRCRRVLRDGVPELTKMLEKGEATANAAAHIAQLPKEEQSAIVQQGPEAVKKKAAELRTEPKPATEPAAEYAAPEEPVRRCVRSDRLYTGAAIR